MCKCIEKDKEIAKLKKIVEQAIDILKSEASASIRISRALEHLESLLNKFF